MEKSDKDRLMEVRDLLRAEWDKLTDPNNGFGVHSGYFRHQAKEKALRVGGDLASAELALMKLSDQQPE